MPQLPDRNWRLKYTPDNGDFVKTFYVPALECAMLYDRRRCVAATLAHCAARPSLLRNRVRELIECAECRHDNRVASDRAFHSIQHGTGGEPQLRQRY